MADSNERITASATALDMYLGPVLISGLLAGVLTAGVGNLFWGDTFAESGHALWMFPAFAIPLFVLTLLHNLSHSRWMIDSGIVYQGNKPLFQLRDIQAVQLGVPDNWITKLAGIPGIQFTRARTARFAAEMQKEMLVMKLTENRWFVWSGHSYQNGMLFRNRLMEAAPVKQIEDLPVDVAKRLTVRNRNRVLVVG
jgi:hypothetical protein